MRGIDNVAWSQRTPRPAEGFTPTAVAWRMGWSGPGRAAGVALAVGWGVAADRLGPDRVGVEGAAVGGRGAGGLGSGTGAHLRRGRGGLRGVAPEGGDVGPCQRHFRIPPDPRQRRPPGIRQSGRSLGSGGEVGWQMQSVIWCGVEHLDRITQSVHEAPSVSSFHDCIRGPRWKGAANFHGRPDRGLGARLRPVRAEDARLEVRVVRLLRAARQDVAVVRHVDRRRLRRQVDLEARHVELHVLVRREQVLEP